MADEKREKIFDQVASIIAEHFDVDEAKITDDLDLRNDLDADSIDFVEFVLELEDTFGQQIDDDEAEKLHTVGQVVDYINAHVDDDDKKK